MIPSHSTGFLYQYEGSPDGLPPCESWHRTLLGAHRAWTANGERGAIYRLTGDDTSDRVFAPCHLYSREG